MTAEREPKEEKKQAVEGLKEKMSKAEAIILTEYQGLTVAELTDFRVKLRKIRGELRILQNRLTKIAIRSLPGQESLSKHLVGPTAAVIGSGDPVILAKAVKDFAAEKEKFKIKGAIVSGRFMATTEITRLADMPPRETLITHVFGLIVSPLRRLVTALSHPQRSLVVTLGQIAAKKQG